MVHGDRQKEADLEELVRRFRLAVLIHGHSHIARVKRVGASLIVNPGTPTIPNPSSPFKKTVAVLDTSGGSVRVQDIETGQSRARRELRSVTFPLIILCLVAIVSMVSVGSYVQYRRYRSKYEHIARSLCDPGTWRVTFHLRTLLLRGRIGDHAVCYSVFGDERKNEPVNSYFLLRYPVRRNFRFYVGSDLDQADGEIRSGLARFQGLPDFRGLLATSNKTPFLARLIVRPLGFGYDPGLLLWKWGTGVFDPATIRRDFDLLLGLAEEGI